MSDVLFDDVLKVAANELARYSIASVTLLRDSFGALSVIVPDDTENSVCSQLAQELHRRLGVYSPGESEVVLRQKDLIDPRDILDSPDRIQLDARTWLIDRLQTNQDWLRSSLQPAPPIPTAVAYSIKGGVGRSSAFSVWGWHLARLGKNVVLVDLDLEAPGLAGLTLKPDGLPSHGLVDWLTEALVGQATPELLADCLAPAPVAADLPGSLQVLPAWGLKTTDYVAKLGRVYMPTFFPREARYEGLADRLVTLLQQLRDLPSPPDLVLLDARAGLHDIGAAAVTRLGAEVFLFARDDFQTWQSYEQLFQHLSRAHDVRAGMPDSDLRWRMKMVAAQLDSNQSAVPRYVETSYEAWSGLYDDEGSLPASDGPATVFAPQDADAPHYPLVIRFDGTMRNLGLADEQTRPAWEVVSAAFKDFLDGATTRLLPEAMTP